MQWRPAAPAGVALADGEIHVWRVDLDCVRDSSSLAALSAAERARASRFRFDVDRARFTACRRVLRSLLAAYADTAPERLDIEEGRGRKPRLADDAVRFNVTHSQGTALLAFARDVEIGIDLEHVRAIEDWPELAERLYTPRELRTLHDHPNPQFAFLTCWTRKEAYVKYTGSGLDDSLDTIHVGAGLDPAAIDEVRIRSFRPDPHTVAGIAVPASSRVEAHWRFQA